MRRPSVCLSPSLPNQTRSAARRQGGGVGCGKFDATSEKTCAQKRRRRRRKAMDVGKEKEKNRAWL